jgi:hypothetical protein
LIVEDVLAAYAEGRKIIVLTGRTEHLIGYTAYMRSNPMCASMTT